MNIKRIGIDLAKQVFMPDGFWGSVMLDPARVWRLLM